jgi:uncharacterized protein (TIGR02145 family)
MNTIKEILLALLILIVGIFIGRDQLKKDSTAPKQQFSDDINSFTKQEEIKIGGQYWMKRNLSVDYFRNGDEIPYVESANEWKKAGDKKQPAWCYYNNDSLNGEKYGKLYNWYAVNDPRGIAPEGYHVPTDLEWKMLTNYLEGEEFAGKKMKSTSGWYDNLNGTNESGFSGLPCGSRGSCGSYAILGGWWSSTAIDKFSAYHRYLRKYMVFSLKPLGNKCKGLSVRCLRD